MTEEVMGASRSRYSLAGWLSILHAMVVLPKVGVDFFVETLTGSGYDILRLYMGFHVVGALLGIYVLKTFRRMLNERYGFHAVDKLISALMLCYLGSALAWAVDLGLGSDYSVIDAVYIFWIMSAALSVVYAFKLLSLDNRLFGLLKPYVYTTIASSALGLTVVIGEFATPFSMASLVILGIILIRAESEDEYL